MAWSLFGVPYVHTIAAIRKKELNHMIWSVNGTTKKHLASYIAMYFSQ